MAPRPTANDRTSTAPTPTREALAVLRTASHDELLAYGRDLLARGERFEDVVTLLQFLANDRPELAVELSRELGRNDGERQVFLYATLSAWAGVDAPTALRWAGQHSSAYDVPGHASLLYITLEEIAADNPNAAVAATESILRSDGHGFPGVPPHDVARFTLEALIKTGRVDVAQAALAHWSDGPEAKQLAAPDFQVVALALAAQSFKAAGAWLDSLAGSPARNEAYLGFATAWAEQDPAAAMDWAQRLNPASGGDDVRVATFARWVKSDRSAATQWLVTQSGPDPTRARLLAILNAPMASN